MTWGDAPYRVVIAEQLAVLAGFIAMEARRAPRERSTLDRAGARRIG